VSDEVIQILAAATVTLLQVYIMEPWKFTAFAKFWDWLARFSAALADKLGWISVQARSNYYASVSAIGE
jgi:hypothetical protein